MIFMTRAVSDNTFCASATTGVLERFFQFSFAVPLVPGVLVQQLLKSIINEHVLDRIRFQKGVDHEPCLGDIEIFASRALEILELPYPLVDVR